MIKTRKRLTTPTLNPCTHHHRKIAWPIILSLVNNSQMKLPCFNTMLWRKHLLLHHIFLETSSPTLLVTRLHYSLPYWPGWFRVLYLHGKQTVLRSRTCRRNASDSTCSSLPRGSALAHPWWGRCRRWPGWPPWRWRSRRSHQWSRAGRQWVRLQTFARFYCHYLKRESYTKIRLHKFRAVIKWFGQQSPSFWSSF